MQLSVQAPFWESGQAEPDQSSPTAEARTDPRPHVLWHCTHMKASVDRRRAQETHPTSPSGPRLMVLPKTTGEEEGARTARS